MKMWETRFSLVCHRCRIIKHPVRHLFFVHEARIGAPHDFAIGGEYETMGG